MADAASCGHAGDKAVAGRRKREWTEHALRVAALRAWRRMPPLRYCEKCEAATEYNKYGCVPCRQKYQREWHRAHRATPEERQRASAYKQRNVEPDLQQPER
jgi:hypothetical protein